MAIVKTGRDVGYKLFPGEPSDGLGRGRASPWALSRWEDGGKMRGRLKEGRWKSGDQPHNLGERAQPSGRDQPRGLGELA